jgi:membrane-associated protein
MIISELFNLFIHIDKYLIPIIQTYGWFIYPLIFIVLFCETGLVVTPFLPGDSLIFVSGTLVSSGLLNLWILYILMILAAILGDTVNYFIGTIVGPKVFKNESSRFLNKKNLEKTQLFYEKHGGKTIIFARFMPIIRTIAPFVAGIGKMNYKKFLAYNIIGGILWVSIFLFGGYYFGKIDFVKNNLTLVILTIVFISFLPPIIQYIKEKLR